MPVPPVLRKPTRARRVQPPDLPVGMAWADYMAGIDAAMAAIVEALGSGGF